MIELNHTYFINEFLGCFTVLEKRGDWFYGIRFTVNKLRFELTKTHFKEDQLKEEVVFNFVNEFNKYVMSDYPYKSPN